MHQFAVDDYDSLCALWPGADSGVKLRPWGPRYRRLGYEETTSILAMGEEP